MLIKIFHSQVVYSVFQSQRMNPSNIAISPSPLPATSLPPVASPFFPVGEADAEDGFPVVEAVAAASNVCPRLGSLAFPLTIQPSLVDVGHAGGVRPGVDSEYADSFTPAGVRVAHWLWRLL